MGTTYNDYVKPAIELTADIIELRLKTFAMEHNTRSVPVGDITRIIAGVKRYAECQTTE